MMGYYTYDYGQVAVAVVDAGGNLKALATMDDAPEGYAGAAFSKVKGEGGDNDDDDVDDTIIMMFMQVVRWWWWVRGGTSRRWPLDDAPEGYAGAALSKVVL
jgi:hypothetical protein